MASFLMLRLEAPLMAFGDVLVDAIGPVRDAPSGSALTGLLANALGLRREECERLDRLQQRLVFGSRVDRPGERLTEFQTAKLGAGDRGWTTYGRPEGRGGVTATYNSAHLRYRDHDAGKRVTIALHLDPEDEQPDINAISAALDEPQRPLFLGRKSCLPSHRILLGFREAENLYAALLAEPVAKPIKGPQWRVARHIALFLPWDQPHLFEHSREIRFCDRRDWKAGLHAGEVRLRYGSVPRDAFQTDVEALL